MSKVWRLEDFVHGETYIYTEDTDILSIPFVTTEMTWLDDAYVDERDEFVADIKWARQNGRGSATIEERFTVELLEVSGELDV